MDRIDFVELAAFCTSRAKDGYTHWAGKYERTHYVCILEDNTIRYSMTPHILRNANKCILMHEMSEIPISNIYYWYEFEYINPEGCVYASDLENGFELTSFKRKQESPFIELRNNNKCLYYNLNIQKVWELYLKIKDVSSETEMKLIADLFKKEEIIFELEKETEDLSFANHLLKLERDQYKDLLKDINDIVKNKL